MVTIAASQVLYQIVISQSNITGGTSGMVSLPTLELFGYRFNHNGKIGYYYVALLILVASTMILHVVTRSRYGRAIVAMRDHKFYAVSRGMSETRIRLFTLVVSAALAGVASELLPALMRRRLARQYSASVLILAFFLSMLLLAGEHHGQNIWGPIPGRLFFDHGFGAFRAVRRLAQRHHFAAAHCHPYLLPSGLWALLQTAREAMTPVRTPVDGDGDAAALVEITLRR